MAINLWTFLAMGAVGGIAFAIVTTINVHKHKMKKLEIEALNLKAAQPELDALRADVEKMVADKLLAQSKRIEVLEAIVTDKNYDLREKISSL